MTFFFVLVLRGNYGEGGGGLGTKFYCWHVLTYFYKKIFRRELVISFSGFCCAWHLNIFYYGGFGGGKRCLGQVYVKQVRSGMWPGCMDISGWTGLIGPRFQQEENTLCSLHFFCAGKQVVAWMGAHVVQHVKLFLVLSFAAHRF